MKKWIIGKPEDRIVSEFAAKCDLSRTALKIAVSRGFVFFQQLVDFFNCGSLSDPFLIADMKKAAEIIERYIDEGRLICIYGDYDCDGITATALLYSYLENMGANVTYYINEREDGYGMTVDAVKTLKEKGVELIVTVDNGISCLLEAEEAARLGVKLIITDHHQPPEILPRAEAVVNPHREDCPSSYKDLAGVGVALKLCAALDGGEYDAVIEQFADICAIGTVGDLVPLSSENRVIVTKGLAYLKNTESYGLNALLDKSLKDRSKLDSGALAFQLCPRINAAGRFASPLLALELLLTEDPARAEELAEELVKLNQQRKDTEADIIKQINAYIDENPQILNERVMILVGKGWHHGVIGIVCSRLLEAYGKPNIVLSVDENGMARGSARSLRGFNIHDCFTYASEYLEKYGGHECAGGLTIKEKYIPAFSKKVLAYASAFELMPAPVLECDILIEPEDMNIESIRTLERLEPFGSANPHPLFYLPNCRVNNIYPLADGKYSKLDITYMEKRFYVLVFFAPPERLFCEPGQRIDIAANIEINNYNGKESLAFKAVDMKPQGFETQKYIAAADSYERFSRGEFLPKNYLLRIRPSRNELVKVYKLLQSCGGEMNVETLFLKINASSMNYCKLRIIIDAFCQASLAKLTPSSGMVKLIPPTKREDLEKTPVLIKLNAMINE